MNKYQEAYEITFDDLIPMPKLNERNRDWLYFQMDVIKEACDKANKYDELQKIFNDRHICEIKARFKKIECNADKCDTCPLAIGDEMCLKITFEDKWKFQEERDTLKQKLQELLGKEKSKKPIEYCSEITNSEDAYIFNSCPVCKKYLYINQKYCDNCGVEIDWSEE